MQKCFAATVALAALAHCSSGSTPAIKATSGTGSGSAAAAPPTETELVHVRNGREFARERFSVAERGSAMTVRGRYQSGIGVLDFDMAYDQAFRLVQGTIALTPSAIVAAPPGEGSASGSASGAITTLLSRDSEGKLVNNTNGGGSSSVATSPRSVDWFVGGPASAFFVPVCAHHGDDVEKVTAYLDEDLELLPVTQLQLLEARRVIDIHRIKFAATNSITIVACEDGALVGERAGKVVAVRPDDELLRDALSKQ